MVQKVFESLKFDCSLFCEVYQLKDQEQTVLMLLYSNYWFHISIYLQPSTRINRKNDKKIFFKEFISALKLKIFVCFKILDETLR